MFLKQSTAVDVMLGPFIDDTDGKTTEEALTLSQADLQLSKNGGAAAQKNDATAATHRYGGNYMVDLNATDTGTVGHLRLMCKESGALPVVRDFLVVPANVYDSLVGGTDTLNADVTQWLGTAAATPTTAGVPEVDVTHVSGTAQTANDNGADINTLITEVAKVPKSDGTATWNATALASINAEADTALSDYDPPTKAELDTAFTEIKGATWASGTDTLEALRDRGDAAWVTATSVTVSDKTGFSLAADQSGVTIGTVTTNTDLVTAAAIADAVWDEAATGHTDAGKAGAQLWTDIDAILADTNELQTDDVPGLIAALNNISAGDVWDVSLADGEAFSNQTAGDRLRKVKWAVANKMEITEADGTVVLYKDDGTTAADVGAPAIDSAAGTTTRDPLFGTT